MSHKDYNKIEKRNKITVNVFGYEKGHPFPTYVYKFIGWMLKEAQYCEFIREEHFNKGFTMTKEDVDVEARRTRKQQSAIYAETGMKSV